MSYRLTDKDKQYISDNFLNQKAYVISHKLGFSENTIRRYLMISGNWDKYKSSHKSESGKRLSVTDKKYILDNLESKSMNEIAEDIGFKWEAVNRFLKKVDKKPTRKYRKPNTRDQHSKMKEFASGLGFKNTAEAIQEYGHK